MNRTLGITAAIAAALLSAGGANAQQGGHAGHAPPSKVATPAPSAGSKSSTDAFKAANEKMHIGMAIAYTGDADVDFVRGMIPHHQGAVEMAKVVLQYGKDPKLKKLARDIIRAQDKEIAFMQRWLAKARK